MDFYELIKEYFADHSETSSYINGQLLLVQQAVMDADSCRENGNPDYAIANLVIARHLIDSLARILELYPSHIWDDLVIIFHAVDNKLNQETKKKSNN